MPHDVLPILKNAARSGQTRLDLSDQGLTKFPPEIWRGVEIEYVLRVDSYYNPVIVIRKVSLYKLKEINLNRNTMVTLPPEVGQLHSLIKLELQNNQLTNLPPEIGKLINLAELNLNQNKLITLPPQIGGLGRLTSLDLGGNNLKTLPSAIEKIRNLVTLNLSNNRLTTLPPGICRLRNLKILDLRGNQLTTLPDEIRQLRLKKLCLAGNPLPIPPEVLMTLQDRPEELLQYYFKIETDNLKKRALNEAKILIVGQGAVGKTSLIKRLAEDRFDPMETKTEGVDIDHWQLTIEDADILLNVWDFGGQEIMHATHQFFLTKRSLYLLVLDSRLDEQENRAEYWLKMIQSFGGDSPIIVVCNKCDEHELEVDWKGLQAKYPTIKDYARRVSCKTGEGIPALEEILKREVAQLEHLHDELPLSWFEIKAQLEKMKADYISYTQYKQMCVAKGIAEKRDQETLIGFLHDLGVILHFRDHPILEDTNVLNPEWVTKGVYQILNSNLLAQHKGILQRETLAHVLDPKAYPVQKHQFIIDMMHKFELCFDFEGFTGKRFLVPDLLPKEEPYTGEWDDSLAFQYHYDILPNSIISRFIVRMYVYISKRTYWRTGVVLISEDHQNRALVKADLEERKIFIAVAGREATRSTFLAIIRADFHKIHRTISRLKVKEVVPLPGYPDVTIDYPDLLKLRERGVRQYYYPKADVEIDVEHLLDSLEPGSRSYTEHADAPAPHTYFLSYSRENSDAADHLELALSRQQRSVLRDETHIAAGGCVSTSVEQMIQQADTFVALWNMNYAQSDWCPNELVYARTRQANGQKPSRIVLIALDQTEVPIRFIDTLRLNGQVRGQRELAVQRLVQQEAE